MPFESAPREMESLIEQRFGKLAARIALASFVAAPICIVIGLLVAGATWVKHHVVTRLPGLPTTSIQPSSWTDITLSVAITIAAVGIAVYLIMRWFRKERDFEIGFLDEFFKASVFPRIGRLEQNAASVESVTARCEAIEAAVAKLDAQILKPASIAPSPQTLRDLLLSGIIKPSIASVDKIKP